VICIKFKFRTKLYAAYSLIVIFLLICFSVFMRVHIFNQIEEETTYNDLQLGIKISENFDTYVEKMDDITKKLISNTSLQSILKKNTSPNYQSGYEMLKDNREIAPIIANAITLTTFSFLNVYLYNQNGSYKYVYYQDKSNFDLIMRNAEYIDKLNDRQLVIFPNNNYSEDYKEDATISFMRPIFDIRANMYGYVELQSDYSKLDDICDINNIGDVVLMNDDGHIIYPSTRIDERIRSILLENVPSCGSGVFRDDNGNIYFYCVSDYSELITYIRYPINVIHSSLNLLQRITIIFFACVTTVSILMVFIFTKMLVRPLQNLHDSILHVTYEDMGLTINNTVNNEIVALKDAFQSILDDLKMTAEREIASNKAEAHARLSALQAQIAPHFIHNVLYSISISAQEERMEDVVSMSKQLSDMLRYTVNSNAHMVRMEDEMKCVSNYLSLQGKYYEDFLKYEVRFHKEAGDLIIPRLCILPFVENAIQHAFENMKPPYQIIVIGEVRGDRWLVQVIDNGNGFTEDKIKEIQCKLTESTLYTEFEKKSDNNEPGMCGMGIVNSVLRLKILFGDQFIFTISNNLSENGATIQLEGPIVI
jgi:two-component system, sensor histidine kinase YesM